MASLMFWISFVLAFGRSFGQIDSKEKDDAEICQSDTCAKKGQAMLQVQRKTVGNYPSLLQPEAQKAQLDTGPQAPTPLPTPRLAITVGDYVEIVCDCAANGQRGTVWSASVSTVRVRGDDKRAINANYDFPMEYVRKLTPAPTPLPTPCLAITVGDYVEVGDYSVHSQREGVMCINACRRAIVTSVSVSTVRVRGDSLLNSKDLINEALDFPMEQVRKLDRTPIAEGCASLDRQSCCKHMDGRKNKKYRGQMCVPSVDGEVFTSGNTCEPNCWAAGTCGSGKFQGVRVGSCQAPGGWGGCPTPAPTEPTPSPTQANACVDDVAGLNSALGSTSWTCTHYVNFPAQCNEQPVATLGSGKFIRDYCRSSCNNCQAAPPATPMPTKKGTVIIPEYDCMMVETEAKGYCSTGYYGGNCKRGHAGKMSGATEEEDLAACVSLEACSEQCFKEEKCKFIAYKKNVCSRYDESADGCEERKPGRHVIHQKVPVGNLQR